MYIFGGYDGNTRVNELFKLDLSTYVWTLVETANEPPSHKYNFASVVSGNRLFLFSGHSGAGSSNDIWVYHFRTRLWEQIDPSGSQAPNRRFGHTGVLNPAENAIYFYGGIYGNTLCEGMWKFEIDNQTWTKVSDWPPGCCYHAAVYVPGLCNAACPPNMFIRGEWDVCVWRSNREQTTKYAILL